MISLSPCVVCLAEYKFCSCPPSMIAAASIAAALHGLDWLQPRLPPRPSSPRHADWKGTYLPIRISKISNYFKNKIENFFKTCTLCPNFSGLPIFCQLKFWARILKRVAPKIPNPEIPTAQNTDMWNLGLILIFFLTFLIFFFYKYI